MHNDQTIDCLKCSPEKNITHLNTGYTPCNRKLSDPQQVIYQGAGIIGRLMRLKI